MAAQARILEGQASGEHGAVKEAKLAEAAELKAGSANLGASLGEQLAGVNSEINKENSSTSSVEEQENPLSPEDNTTPVGA